MGDLSARLATAIADRYRIERQLGQGGMALVYLAHDVKHDRRVALKLLRPELAAVLGADRFLQEIKVTANLQHPHILPLHDSGEAGGLVFYVMPYVEGESLRDRLSREKQLGIEEALEITRTVAGALDYAHRHGVIHRDIKPENILLHDGQPMVGDFGIALAVSAAGGTRLTETGLSLGTPHYMSPEQAMGERQLDARSDVYSLAAVLYEMLAGAPPFTGPTAQAIVARVVTDEPRPLAIQRSTVPPHVEAAVLKALQKLPADRFATAGQFAAALYMPTAMRSPPRLPRWRAALPWSVAGVAAAAALWIGAARRDAGSASPPVVRFDLAFGNEVEPRDGPGPPITLSPEGSRIVFLGLDAARNSYLFTRLLDRIDPFPIAGTEDANQPFFSPDGRWLGFFQDAKLRKVPVAGGAVVTICDLAAGMTGASWGKEDVIVFGSRRRLYRVSAVGGTPTLLAAPDSASDALAAYRWPELLPDGRTVVFSRMSTIGPRLAALTLDDPTVRDLGMDGISPRYVDGGYVVFAQSDGTLFAARFDARRLRFAGSPQAVIEGVRLGPSPVAKLGIARTGALAFLSIEGGTSDMVLADRQGRLEVVGLPPQRYRNPRFSPDGRRLAFDINLGSPVTGDIWTYDLTGRTLTRLTFDSSGFRADWSPDGRRITFTHRRGVENDLHWVAADGSGATDTLVAGPTIQTAAQFTPDAKTVFFAQGETDFGAGGTRWDIWTMPVDSPQAARPFLASPYSEQNPMPSPDGRWLAYQANETGSNAVYVRAIAGGAAARVRISPAQGTNPRWSAGGRELFYRSGDSLMVVAIGAGPQLSFSAPRAVVGGLANTAGFDVHPSGQRFVWVRPRSNDAPRIHVLLNWFGRPPSSTPARR